MTGLRVISVVCPKGGVGKTTVATNLAIYLRALREDLPVLLIGLDGSQTLARVFAFDTETPPAPSPGAALGAGSLSSAIRLGQYGVHYVQAGDAAPAPGEGPLWLRRALVASGWSGLVVIDTKSDAGTTTQGALAASDLALLPVADQASLEQVERLFERLAAWGRPRDTARVLLTLVDRRVRYRSGQHGDVLALLLAEVRRLGLPCFETFLSRSPRIAALHTNGERRMHAILHAARGSLADRQMAQLAHDVLRALALPDAPVHHEPGERRGALRWPFPERIPAFASGGPPIVALEGRDISRGGMAVAPDATRAGRLHLALPVEGSGERLLVWASVIRRDADRTALRFEPGEDEGLRQRLGDLVAALAPHGDESDPAADALSAAAASR